MSSATTRNALASRLRDQARWRRIKSGARPDDLRNAQWATHLDELADWVEALPPRHPQLVRLDRVWGAFGLDVFGVSGPLSSQLTSRPDVGADEAAQWLETFVDTFIEETLEMLEDGDPGSCLEWVQDPDPTIALPALRRLQYRLEEWEEEAVLKAQVEGMSWARIGELLGRSKQTVWEKHHDPDDQSVG